MKRSCICLLAAGLPAVAAMMVSTAAAQAAAGDSAGVARARADSLRHPYTQADVSFMSGMISHHAQAIAMARMAPTHGASPTIRRCRQGPHAGRCGEGPGGRNQLSRSPGLQQDAGPGLPRAL